MSEPEATVENPNMTHNAENITPKPWGYEELIYNSPGKYCVKLLVYNLRGIASSLHYHEKKEETFHVLHGKVDLVLDGVPRTCEPGDVVTVERGVRHAFSSSTGAVMEEISSTHFVDDSHYTDPSIGQNEHRKTLVTYWID